MTSRVLETADELYALRLEEFVAARDEQARRLRTEEPEAAGQVARLRKPSVAAWVVNLFVRHETEQVTQLLQVGESLRQAQQGLDGEELRALTRQRRQLTAALTSRARRLAASRGRSVSSAVAEQVEATLTAAMVDPACAEAVRSGLLVGPLRTTGMGDEDVGAVLAVAEARGFAATPVAVPGEAGEEERGLSVVTGDAGAAAATDERAAERARAERRLAAAEEELRSAGAATAEAESRVEELRARRLRLVSELEELRRRVAGLEGELETADTELTSAEGSADEARQTETAARQERDEAAETLGRLE